MKEKKTHKFKAKYILHDIVKVIAGIPGLIWHRPRVLYESPEAKKHIKGGALLVSNHLGFFDPIYMQYAVWYRRHHFICLKKFAEGGLGWLFKIFLCIPIDKENFSIGSFHEIVEHLENGELVSMFPEGKVNDGSGQMDQFKSGVIVMALKSHCPIYPLYIKQKEHWYQRITMIMGKPVTVSMQGASINLIDDKARELREKEVRLAKLLEEKLCR